MKLGQRLLRVRSEAGEVRCYYVPKTTRAVARYRDYGGKWQAWVAYGPFGSFLKAQRAMLSAFGGVAR